MKVSLFVISFVLLGIVCGCNKDASVNQSGNQQFREDTSAIGYGTVVGYEGYFSPEVGPHGEVSIFPPGYVMTNYDWIQGAPDTLHPRIYLTGKASDLSKAHRVRVRGNWAATMRTDGTDSLLYINMSIDSLEVLE